MLQRPYLILIASACLSAPFQMCFGQLPTPIPSPSPLPTATPGIPTAPPNVAVAIVTYPNGAGSVISRCPLGIFDLIAVQPGQAVDVVIQYPVSLALQTVAVEPLDGGQVSFRSPNTPIVQIPNIPLPISPTGTLAFNFKPGTEPGLYQVSLRQGSTELGLQFWVVDPADPTNTPPALDPVTNPMN